MFDEDQSGFLDEDEYRYAMEYLVRHTYTIHKLLSVRVEKHYVFSTLFYVCIRHVFQRSLRDLTVLYVCDF